MRWEAGSPYRFEQDLTYTQHPIKQTNTEIVYVMQLAIASAAVKLLYIKH